jgi:hypothetical protein
MQPFPERFCPQRRFRRLLSRLSETVTPPRSRLPKLRLQNRCATVTSESWFGSSGGGLPKRPDTEQWQDAFNLVVSHYWLANLGSGHRQVPSSCLNSSEELLATRLYPCRLIPANTVFGNDPGRTTGGCPATFLTLLHPMKVLGYLFGGKLPERFHSRWRTENRDCELNFRRINGKQRDCRSQ